MAQVGRISGPLLEANLLRKGYTNNPSQDNLSFKNTNSDTSLLKIDVTSGRIGIDKDAPANDLQVSQTTRTVNLIGDISNIANFEIQNSSIATGVGNIYLSAQEQVNVSTLETEQFLISDNYILTHSTNTDINLTPNGSGLVQIGDIGWDPDTERLRIYGSVHASGNVTLGGLLSFGNALGQDDVIIDAAITSDVVPDQNRVYNLGAPNKRWGTLYTRFLNGEEVNTQSIVAGGVRVDLRVGNILYVSVNGNDTAYGDHPQAPLATIKEALSRSDGSTNGPVTIYVYPGEYQEELPLVVPANVSVVGVDIRNCVVMPDTNSQSEDVFHLSDSSTITNLTIKNFYYDSVNNTGHAFRFAPGAVITSRSPYAQNVTVISQETSLGANDAGRGAWIDGSELDSASIEASMLFHSCTFITPNADCINMTNGVRVEWLNSFTYFANRGLYAFNGVTGRTTYDGSTVQYGAEVRSIGSANVYGNYGAVADGADTLMYLIQHNFAYIGSGTDSSNDDSLIVQANEVVEVNSGQIHFVTTDQTGNFRIGDNFLVDFNTGSTTLDLSGLTVNFNDLIITSGINSTYIGPEYLEISDDFRISGNIIQTLVDDLNINSATNTINLQDNANVSGNIYISDDFSFGGTVNIKGDEATDRITFNVEFDQDLNPNRNSVYKLGSFEKKWLISHLSRVETSNIITYDNIITTTESNSDLELYANGTGNIYVPSNATFTNDVLINGTSDLTDTTINGDLTHTGDRTQTGNYNIAGELTVDDIYIEDNFITTNNSNADLELRSPTNASIVITNGNVQINNNLTISNATSLRNVSILPGNITHIGDYNVTGNFNTNGNLTNGTLLIKDNFITTLESNTDLELRANGTGDILVPDNNVQVNNNLAVSGATTLNNVIINGTLTHSGTRTQEGDTSVSGNINIGQNLSVGASAQFEEILVDDNFITTTTTNADLELRAAGTGTVNLQTNVNVDNNLSANDVDTTNVTVTLNTTGDNANIGNIEINDNYIETTSLNGDLTLSADRNVIVTGTDVRIVNDLTVSTDTDLQETSITGLLSHTGDTTQTGNVVLNGEWTNGNIYIEDNFITTTQLNADLDLRASGTGNIAVPNNNVTFGQDLTVQGVTDLQSVSITGTLARTGAYNQTGNYTINGELTVDNVYVEDNFITTTSGNLTLEAAGTGIILTHTNNVAITNNLDVDGVTNLDVTNIDGNLTHVGDRTQTGNYDIAGELSVDDILIEDNFITTTVSNANLELRAPVSVTSIFIGSSSIDESGETLDGGSSGTSLFASLLDGGNSIVEISPQDKIILVPSNDVEIANNLTVIRLTSLTNTTITGSLLHTGNRTQTGNYTIAGEITNGNILIEDNFISTTNSSSDLELRASGTGTIIIPNNNVTISSDLAVDGVTDLDDTTINGTLTHTGNRTQTGNYDIGGQPETFTVEFTVDVDGTFSTAGQLTYGYLNWDASDAGGNAVVDQLISLIDEEEEFSLYLNGDLVLTDTVLGNGAGKVYNIENEFHSVGFRVTTGWTAWTSLRPSGATTGDVIRFEVLSSIPPARGKFVVDNVYVEDNFITTTAGNLILEAAGTGNVVIDTNDVEIAQDLTVNGDVSLQNTTISGTITQTGDRTQTGNLDIAGEISNGNILIEDNFISTTASNSDLELRAAGTGNIVIDTADPLVIENNLIVGGTLSYTGSLLIDGDLVQVGTTLQTGSLTVSSDLSISKKISVAKHAQFEEILIDDNFITTTSSNTDLELRATSTGEVIIAQPLQVDNNFTIGSLLESGNITVATDTASNTFTTGILDINSNYFKVTTNDDVELRANGTGIVLFNNSLTADQDFTADNVNILDTNITGTLTQNGDRIQTGNLSLTGNVATTLNLSTTSSAILDGVLINGNYISSLSSNSDLELRAAGTGNIVIDSDINIKQDLSVEQLSATTLTVSGNLAIEEFEASTNITFYDNVITTTESNSDLELRAAGTGSVFLENVEVKNNKLQTVGDSTYNEDIIFSPTSNLVINGTGALEIPTGTTEDRLNIVGDIRFTTDDYLFEGTGKNNARVTFGGVYSENRQTSVTADPYSNNIRMMVQGASNPLDSSKLVAEVTGDEFTMHKLQVESITLSNNRITTIDSNANLDLRANGTGELSLGNISLSNNLIKKSSGTNLTIRNTGFGHVKFNGTGVVIPYGTTGERPVTTPQVGDTRWNTTTEILETWDGNQYLTAAGVAAAISEQEFNDLLLEYTLIFG